MAYHDGIGKLIQRLEMTNEAKHLPSRYSASLSVELRNTFQCCCCSCCSHVSGCREFHLS